MLLAEPMAFTTGTPIYSRTLPARETISGSRGLVTTTAASSGEWLHEVRVQIKELLLLDEGWDSSVAAPISGNSVQEAINFLTLVAEAVDGLRRPYVSPTANGGVNLEWHVPEAHFDVTVEDGDARIFASAPGGEWEGFVREIPTDAIGVLFLHFADR